MEAAASIISKISWNAISFEK